MSRPAIETDVIRCVTAEIEKIAAEFLPDDWTVIELRGGPFDGLGFPVPVEHVGNPDVWVFLPVSRQSFCGDAAYAWYQHVDGESRADFWQCRWGKPETTETPDARRANGAREGHGESRDRPRRG